MSIRSTFIMVAAILAATSTLAASNPGISIPAGATHEGNLETRNGAIRIGEEAVVEGSLESRNGNITTGTAVSAGDVFTRNGAIVLGDNGRYGHVESRNGRIKLGGGTSADTLETRNGSILIGAGARTGKLISRNGGISIDPDAVVDGVAKSRNGSIALESDSRVTGRITTRNGSVKLSGATAEEGVQTLTGSILLEAGSRSGGDLVIEITDEAAGYNSNFFGLFGSRSWPEAGDIRVLDGSEVDGDVVLVLDADYDEAMPTVEIGNDAVVTGSLRIDSRVELIVDGAVGGEIERVTP